MRYLRSIVATLILIALGFAVYSGFNHGGFDDYLYHSYCDKTRTYTLEFVDDRFGMTEKEAGILVDEAAELWNREYGAKLFRKSIDGEISVRFVYDERQALNTDINESEENLEKKRSDLEVRGEQFDAKVVSFKKRSNDLNGRISYWNNRGGAPIDEYQKLMDEQEILKHEAEKLNAEAKELNRSADFFNTEIRDLNTTIKQFNQEIADRPEMGLYDGEYDTIDIYLYSNMEELRHTLIHEFGHALGLDHAKDRISIMFPFTTKVTQFSDEDRNMLRVYCRKRSVFEIFQERMEIIIFYLKTEVIPRMEANIRSLVNKY